jgi:hypothetical protein
MDMTDERPSKYWPDVEGMNMTDIHMMEDTMAEVEVVEREHKSVVLMKHRTDDGAERHQRTHQE